MYCEADHCSTYFADCIYCTTFSLKHLFFILLLLCGVSFYYSLWISLEDWHFEQNSALLTGRLALFTGTKTRIRYILSLDSLRHQKT